MGPSLITLNRDKHSSICNSTTHCKTLYSKHDTARLFLSACLSSTLSTMVSLRAHSIFHFCILRTQNCSWHQIFDDQVENKQTYLYRSHPSQRTRDSLSRKLCVAAPATEQPIHKYSIIFLTACYGISNPFLDFSSSQYFRVFYSCFKLMSHT